jgi:hypothetical protein
VRSPCIFDEAMSKPTFTLLQGLLHYKNSHGSDVVAGLYVDHLNPKL